MEKVFKILRFDLSTSWKTIAPLMAFYFVLGLYYGYTIGDLTVIPVSIMIWVSMAAGIPYVFREKYLMDHLLGTLPVNRKNIIRSGYLLSTMIGVTGISLSEIMICISSALFGVGFDIKKIYASLLISTVLYFLIIGIHIPVYLRWKLGQLVVVSPIILYFAYIIASQLYYYGVLHIELKAFISALWEYFAVSMSGALLLAALLLWISYRLSCRLYLKKDI